MATLIQREAVVGPDGEIKVSAPELTPGQHVKVTIEPQAAPQPSPEEKRPAIEMLREMPKHRLFKTAEEVDAYIREERDSWGR
jgi:hypothetical protein